MVLEELRINARIFKEGLKGRVGNTRIKNNEEVRSPLQEYWFWRNERVDEGHDGWNGNHYTGKRFE